MNGIGLRPATTRFSQVGLSMGWLDWAEPYLDQIRVMHGGTETVDVFVCIDATSDSSTSSGLLRVAANGGEPLPVRGPLSRRCTVVDQIGDHK